MLESITATRIVAQGNPFIAINTLGLALLYPMQCYIM